MSLQFPAKKLRYNQPGKLEARWRKLRALMKPSLSFGKITRRFQKQSHPLSPNQVLRNCCPRVMRQSGVRKIFLRLFRSLKRSATMLNPLRQTPKPPIFPLNLLRCLLKRRKHLQMRQVWRGIRPFPQPLRPRRRRLRERVRSSPILCANLPTDRASHRIGIAEGGRFRGHRGRRYESGAPHGQETARGANHQTQQIHELLKEGQEILVQIAKEPLGTKGARITSHIALPGRYLVYMPTISHIGVSRKIASEEERLRLRNIILENKGSL